MSKVNNNITSAMEYAEEIREITSSFLTSSAKNMSEVEKKELLSKIMENASNIIIMLRAI